MNALEDLGSKVTPFDTSSYSSRGPRLARSARYRLAWGLVVSRLNRELVSAGENVDVDWVWVEKGTWITPRTLARLAAPGRKLIHYTGDPMILFHKTRHFLASIPSYDVLVTPKRYERDLYKRHGARRLMLLPSGYDAQLFRPSRLSSADLQEFSSDVCFVGHYERHYRQLVRAASSTGAEVAVWGAWQRAALTSPWLRQIVRGPGAWDEDYVRALNGAKIGLGLLTRLAPDESTTRTFEIPACGTFLLAQRSMEHKEFFKEGEEAEFFEGEHELKEKIQWYLEHDDERFRIAAAGRKRCVTSGYSYLDRIRTVVAKIG